MFGVLLKITHFFLIVLLSLQLSCIFRTSKKSAPVDLAFYRDTFNLQTLVREEDPAHRRASMRLISQAMSVDQVVGNSNLIAELEDALQLDPYNPFAYYYLGWAVGKKNKWKKSLTLSRKAEQLFQINPVWQGKSLVLQAQAEKGLGNQARAATLYQRAKIMDEKNPLIDEGLQTLAHP